MVLPATQNTPSAPTAMFVGDDCPVASGVGVPPPIGTFITCPPPVLVQYTFVASMAMKPSASLDPWRVRRGTAERASG